MEVCTPTSPRQSRVVVAETDTLKGHLYPAEWCSCHRTFGVAVYRVLGTVRAETDEPKDTKALFMNIKKAVKGLSERTGRQCTIS